MTPTEASSAWSIVLDGGRLDVLELMTEGLTAPIDGYQLPGTATDGRRFVPSLLVPAAISIGESLLLTDPDGTAIARMTVDARDDASVSEAYVGGRVIAVGRPEHPPARAFRLKRSEGRTGRVLAVFDRYPRPDQVLQVVAAAAGRGVDFLAVTWNAIPHDYSISTVVKALQKCAEAWPDSSVRFVALASGGSQANRGEVLDVVVSNIGSPVVVDFLSNTDGPLDRSVAADGGQGAVVLFSGLSGSGKSTIARAVSERLAAAGRRSVLLDGDDFRRVISAGLGFSIADRESNLQRIGWVAARIASVGGIALCAPIAPFGTGRARMRAMAEEHGRFVLVHVATPLEVCEARDRKGLYMQARAGLITDFTGIDSPYEVPTDADLVIGANDDSIDSMVEKVLNVIDPQ